MIYEMTTMVKWTRFVLLGVQLHELMFAVRVSAHRAMAKTNAKLFFEVYRQSDVGQNELISYSKLHNL